MKWILFWPDIQNLPSFKKQTVHSEVLFRLDGQTQSKVFVCKCSCKILINTNLQFLKKSTIQELHRRKQKVNFEVNRLVPIRSLTVWLWREHKQWPFNCTLFFSISFYDGVCSNLKTLSQLLIHKAISSSWTFSWLYTPLQQRYFL